MSNIWRDLNRGPARRKLDIVNRIPISVGCVLGLVLSLRGFAGADDTIAHWETLLPSGVDELTDARQREIVSASEAVEQWAADLTWSREAVGAEQLVVALKQLVAAKQRVDARLERLLELRSRFADLPAGEQRRGQVRCFLRMTATLIDLSGRLRYLLRDAIDNATYDLSPHPALLDEVIDHLIENRVDIAASVMTYALFDPPADSGAQPFSDAAKAKVLMLLAVTQQIDVLADLAEFIAASGTSDELIVSAAEAIRAIGMPQDPRPGYRLQRAFVEPAITARQLHAVLSDVDEAKLSPMASRHRSELLAWLDERNKHGIVGDRYRIGSFEVQSGDWVLMRNPSPYNTFTDLSPGLFTHVGVVAVEQDEHGIRRFVLVDLPERGDRIPATNVESYLQTTLHYFILRHKDPRIASEMGDVAESVIGNPTQFDLTFRTDRVSALRGKLTKDSVINTYCAGFLLLCAQETTAPREQFFPIPEFPPGGHCLENLKKLGLAIGADFVSPTGAVFSTHMNLVGRRAPMYSPAREIKEAIYDHFGRLMVESELTPSPTTFQSLREKAADLSKSNPWLARALAQAGNVSERVDLSAAARAAAVVETLDEIADGSADEFLAARRALLAGSLDESDSDSAAAGEFARINGYRRQHAALFARWENGEISPRELRVELVEHYVARGIQELTRRFFDEPAD